MPFSRAINTFPTAVLLAVTLATTIRIGQRMLKSNRFQLARISQRHLIRIRTCRCGPTSTLLHTRPANQWVFVFGSSSLTAGGVSGAAVLETQDLQTFSFATGLGYSQQVMQSPVTFTSCRSDPADNTEFDENYVGPGTVVQDPTLPAGNLIMIYEAENHCPGGTNQFDYYASAGSGSLLRQRPDVAGADRPPTRWYEPLCSAPKRDAGADQPVNPMINLGNAIPSAYVDGDYLYIVYEYVTSPSTPADNLMRIARANLVSDNVTRHAAISQMVQRRVQSARPRRIGQLAIAIGRLHRRSPAPGVACPR